MIDFACALLLLGFGLFFLSFFLSFFGGFSEERRRGQKGERGRAGPGWGQGFITIAFFPRMFNFVLFHG